jgi:hypothetical protein
VFWQHAGLLQDQLEAQRLAETVYSEPAQILHLGEDRAGMLMPWLDELIERSIDGGFARNFYRMQALWFNTAPRDRAIRQGLSGPDLGIQACAHPAHAATGIASSRRCALRLAGWPVLLHQAPGGTLTALRRLDQ